MARLSLKMIKEASKIFHGWFSPTPIQFCPHLSLMHACPVILKCDYFQPSGSSHLRSAFYILSSLKEEQKRSGIACFTSPAQSLAYTYAASLLNIPCHVLLLETPERHYKKKLEQYHAEYEVLPSLSSKDLKMFITKRCEDMSVTCIFDSVDPKSAASEGGTMGIELLKQVPQLKNVIIPLKTHALAQGLVALVKKKFPDSVLIGVSLSQKGACSDLISHASRQPIGLDHQIEVTEDAATQAQKWYLEHHLSLIAQEGALGLAAALDPSFPKLHGPTAIILSSNCCDPSALKNLL